MEHRAGELLFEDMFDGRSTGEWAIPPVSLIEIPEHGKDMTVDRINELLKRAVGMEIKT